ncbi:hypothetical protein ELH42_34555 [Rhizobium ruizarguesonis]|uniref:Uncharacterized protein n=1 Tax=Rhizobium ruizarguesonis TaxID=2081791 RepID=A0AB38HV23_9HYPH|nr:hypothetical protein ELH68_03055 [Rhizobium ruizarguesonis]TAZ90334.1 hypothetical protein ELH64_32745 [Rhizobium ruizarguesonis]TBA13215.1 hypothetical protein ELH61_31025 [Rhizobium ruizarguesonis]TBA52889.1 hypothetical protein ELH57_35290 [Rhizobium ruizarguesonis]TBB41579.1 hypothetical protein ELH44_28865 [Rhizobium ruizarguesonis]
MRRIDECPFLRPYYFLLPFCAIANVIAAMGALYLCSARNMEVAITQTAERILPLSFVGIATGKAQEEGKVNARRLPRHHSFHCSKDTRP